MKILYVTSNDYTFISTILELSLTKYLELNSENEEDRQEVFGYENDEECHYYLEDSEAAHYDFFGEISIDRESYDEDIVYINAHENACLYAIIDCSLNAYATEWVSIDSNNITKSLDELLKN